MTRCQEWARACRRALVLAGAGDLSPCSVLHYQQSDIAAAQLESFLRGAAAVTADDRARQILLDLADEGLDLRFEAALEKSA